MAKSRTCGGREQAGLANVYLEKSRLIRMSFPAPYPLLMCDLIARKLHQSLHVGHTRGVSGLSIIGISHFLLGVLLVIGYTYKQIQS